MITYTSDVDGKIYASKRIDDLTITTQIGDTTPGVSVPSEITEEWVVQRFGDSAIQRINLQFSDAFAAINT